jgi:hypothetical protein
MPLVGFEPTIPAFMRARKVPALNRAAAVINSPVYFPTRKLAESQDLV